MKKTIITTICIIIWGAIFAQESDLVPYLTENATPIDLANPNFQFDQEFYDHDLFFFGFVHGSEKPQTLDLELLKTLSKNGVHNYAPEVDFSLAFFFNEYLKTGNEDVLDFACYYYRSSVGQDASVQFRDKWKKLYEFNRQQKKEDQISIVGMDKVLSRELTLTHIAFIAPQEPTGVAVVDSLKFFKTLETNETPIISGKPIYKSGKNPAYFFAPEKNSMYERFVSEYEKDSLAILNLFGGYASDLQHIMGQPTTYNREEIIHDNFNKIGLPLIQKGEKIYANYGYSHIHQEKINGFKYLAKLIKDDGNVKLVSIIGMLTDSECLKNRIYKSEGPIILRGTKFKGASYKSYTTSKSYDGDSLFERVNGIEKLKRISGSNDCVLFKLNGANSPLRSTMMFADFKRGGKNWKVEKDAVTTDYFQYIILIRNSKANIPLEE